MITKRIVDNLDSPLARSKGIDSLNGAKVEIIFGDSQGSPSTGRSEEQKLISGEIEVHYGGEHR